jgi:hypothetical protein
MSLQGTSVQVSPLAGGRDTGVADAGAFYVAITPTPGTGIIGSATVTAFTETTPYFVLYNAGLLNIYPVYLRTHCTVAPTGNSAATFWTNSLDTGNRYSSAGTGLTINNTNMASANRSSAVITVGAVVATAATGARRIVSHSPTKFASTEIIHDCQQFNWGGAQQLDRVSLIDNTTTQAHTTINLAPIVIGPNQSMVLVRWGASASGAPTHEFEFGFIEK